MSRMSFRTISRYGFAAIASCALLASFPACTSRSEVAQRAAEAPEVPTDFSLAITVIAPPRGAVQPATLPRGLRPARYILEADGTLRVALGAGATRATYPPPTRIINDARRAEVWSRSKALGLLDPDSAFRTSQSEAGGDPVPPLTRIIAAQNNLSSNTPPTTPPNTPADARPAAPKTASPVALIAISYRGQRDFFSIPFDQLPALSELTDLLAAYAWVRE